MSRPTRRGFVRSISRAAAVFTFDQLLCGVDADVQFVNVAREAGLRTKTIYGSEKRNRFLLETTGCGAAFLDYDRDGHLDLFVANYIDFDPKTAPLPESGPCKYKGIMVACGPPGLTGGKNILFHNRGDGTFADVSEPAGILKSPGTFGLGVAV